MAMRLYCRTVLRGATYWYLSIVINTKPCFVSLQGSRYQVDKNIYQADYQSATPASKVRSYIQSIGEMNHHVLIL